MYFANPLKRRLCSIDIVFVDDYFPIQKVKITDEQIFMLSEGQWGNRIPQTNNIYYKGSDILKITH